MHALAYYIRPPLHVALRPSVAKELQASPLLPSHQTGLGRYVPASPLGRGTPDSAQRALYASHLAPISGLVLTARSFPMVAGSHAVRQPTVLTPMLCQHPTIPDASG